jgi:hypothetical protein
MHVRNCLGSKLLTGYFLTTYPNYARITPIPASARRGDWKTVCASQITGALRDMGKCFRVTVAEHARKN